MEDLMSRLNQEIAAKVYLATKVKDLEVELETIKVKGKEYLEQAILIERERVTQMQWDMEELRRRSMEMELKLNSQQVQSTSELPNSPSSQQNHMLQQELGSSKHQFEDLSKRYHELEVKSKADIKVLVKEVKSLRSSQAELKQHLNQSLEQKSKAEELLQEEREKNEQTRTSLRELLRRCKSITSSSNLFGLVATSDNKIAILLAEVRDLDLAQGVDSASINDRGAGSDDDLSLDEELRQMPTSILVDCGMLRKQVNSYCMYFEKNKTVEKVETEPHTDVNEPSQL